MNWSRGNRQLALLLPPDANANRARAAPVRVEVLRTACGWRHRVHGETALRAARANMAVAGKSARRADGNALHAPGHAEPAVLRAVRGHWRGAWR